MTSMILRRWDAQPYFPSQPRRIFVTFFFAADLLVKIRTMVLENDEFHISC